MDKRIIYSLVLLGLLAAAVISYQPVEEIPVEPEPFNYNVTLGYIASTKSSLPVETYMVSLAEADINEYCAANGVPWRFSFEIECADGQAQYAFDRTQDFADGNILLVGGYGWSSFLCSGARKIAAENNMTLVSMGSTSPLFALQDNAFRLCVNDFRLAEPICAMLDDFEYSSVVVIQRDDGWADGIVDAFKERYMGNIIQTIRYPPETYEDFTPYLDKAESVFSDYDGVDNPCVLFLAFSEASQLLNQTIEYPLLLNTTWFGADGTVDCIQIIDNAGKPASMVKLYCPMQAPDPSNPWYQEINTEYKTQYIVDMSSRESLTYDCCWLMAHCVIDANTTDGPKILNSILEVSRNHNGITGDLSLDENGDRINYSYSIYQYVDENGVYGSEVCGFYIAETGKIDWIDIT
ncbi:MAG: hypothetical protein NWF07_00660 [Candidatus Bathyarchaeota archaeon]|nr:hypothetical protein [Candidatus Bathyarchaeota archaeon]